MQFLRAKKAFLCFVNNCFCCCSRCCRHFVDFPLINSLSAMYNSVMCYVYNNFGLFKPFISSVYDCFVYVVVCFIAKKRIFPCFQLKTTKVCPNLFLSEGFSFFPPVTQSVGHKFESMLCMI